MTVASLELPHPLRVDKQFQEDVHLSPPLSPPLSSDDEVNNKMNLSLVYPHSDAPQIMPIPAPQQEAVELLMKLPNYSVLDLEPLHTCTVCTITSRSSLVPSCLVCRLSLKLPLH